jgi:hypothetical protein
MDTSSNLLRLIFLAFFFFGCSSFGKGFSDIFFACLIAAFLRQTWKLLFNNLVVHTKRTKMVACSD